MNSIAIRRISWKELKQQLPIGLALLLFTVVFQLATVLLFWSTGLAEFQFYSIAFLLVGPSLFAVACGSMLFSGEREAETDRFLERLPLAPRELLLGKLLASFISLFVFQLAIVLFLSVINSVYMVRGGGASFGESILHSLNPFENRYLLVPLLLAIEFFAWGMLVSVFVKRTLISAIITFALAITSAILIGEFVPVEPTEYTDFGYYLRFSLPRLLLAFFVLFLAIVAGGRWLNSRGSDFASGTRQWNRAITSVHAKSVESGPANTLLWQTFRQSRYGMIAYAVIAVVLTGVAMVDISAAAGCGVLLLMGTLVAGVSSLAADNSGRRYRFFVEHYEPPARLWLARVMPWFLLIGLSSLVFAIVNRQSVFAAAAYRNEALEWTFITERIAAVSAGFVLFALTAFACGIVSAQVIRRGILALIIGASVASVLASWSVLMIWLAVPWWWSVLPVPVLLLAISWFAMRGWLTDRFAAKAKVAVAAVVALVSIAIFFGFTQFRVHETRSAGFVPPPYLEFEFSLEDQFFDRAEDSNTKLLQELVLRYAAVADSMHDQSKFASQNQEERPRNTVATMTSGRRLMLMNINYPLTEGDVQTINREMDNNSKAISLLRDTNEFFQKNYDKIVSAMENPWAEFEREPDNYVLADLSSLIYLQSILAEHQKDKTSLSDLIRTNWNMTLLRLCLQGSGHPDISLRLAKVWLNLPHDDSERLSEEIEQIQEMIESANFERISIAGEYRLARRLIVDPDSLVARSGRDSLRRSFPDSVLQLLPWERQRSLLLLDSWARLNLNLVRYSSREFENGPYRDQRGRRALVGHAGELSRLTMTSVGVPSMEIGYEHGQVVSIGGMWGRFNARFAQLDLALKLVLAAQESGKYPKSVSEILPFNPARDAAIRHYRRSQTYFPDGLPQPVYALDAGDEVYRKVADANQPFLLAYDRDRLVERNLKKLDENTARLATNRDDQGSLVDVTIMDGYATFQNVSSYIIPLPKMDEE